MKIISVNRRNRIPLRVLIDNEDYLKVNKYSWWSKPQGYIYTQTGTGYERKTIYLHRFIMNVSKNKEIDHINHNKIDNRKSNLRICTRSQNNMNKPGIRGVAKYKGKWRARIKLNRKEIHIGIYNKYIDALNARKKKELVLFKEFSNV